MSKNPRYLLIGALALIALVFLVVGIIAYQQFDRDLLKSESANQRKMVRIINQSMNRYFETLRFITENTVLNPSFDPQRSAKEDTARSKMVDFRTAAILLRDSGVLHVLSAPRASAGIPADQLSGPIENWKIFKGLPEYDSAGGLVAKERRTIARNILKSFKDIHYVFEMDSNGDLVFLEPFEIQKNITSFNFEFRDYLRLVKASRATAISEGYISHDQNRTQIITVASPIFDATGKVAKVFAASVSAATLRERVFRSLKENLDVQDGTVFYLVDRHAHVVASSNGKNIYFPIEGKSHDEEDGGNLRDTGFFKDIDWTPDVLEKGNVWERNTKSWQVSSLKPDFSGRYANLNGIEVFATLFPTAIIGSESTNWGILIEVPVSQFLASKRSLRIVFLMSGALLIGILFALSIYTLKNFSELEKQLRLKETDLVRISSQVAHDIRSPLAALDSVLGSVTRLPEGERLLIRSAVGRIRDIANSLLSKQRAHAVGVASAVPEAASPQLLSSLIDPVVSEKRLQFRLQSRVEAELRLDASSYGLFAAVQPIEFKRLVSNLVDNAIEAFGEGVGVVIVGLSSRDGHALVSVQDNGKGIPPEVLAKLGNRGETYGKAGGSGLGLYHARTSVESWGGSFEIVSEVGKGTTATVVLPLAPRPDWFVPEIRLTPGKAVVILDDDASIHQIWQGRLDVLMAAAQGLEIVHVSSPGEIRGWVKDNEVKARQALYLFDYELLGFRETGLSLVEELALGERVVLVSSRYEESEVLAGCRMLKVLLIPKGLAGSVPMRVEAAAPAVTSVRERLDAVLIDDDPLACMTWKMTASRLGKKFRAFASTKEFFEEAGGIDRETPVYVDAELSDGAKGDVESLKIHELGFVEVYIATGHEPEKFSGLPHLRSVVGKAPPWGGEG